MMLLFWSLLTVTKSQIAYVQVCVACDYTFNWHPYCNDFEGHQNENGYFVIDGDEIEGLDKEIRSQLGPYLMQENITLNSSVKVFNSYTKMIVATRSHLYAENDNIELLPPLCDLASSPFVHTTQRDQCSLCIAVRNYDYIEYENACCVDFSAPYLYSPMTILYNKNLFFESGGSLFGIFSRWEFLRTICVIVNWIFGYALIIWCTNPGILKDKPKRKSWLAACLREASIAIWLAVVTFTTVGYGDYRPNRRCSRAITIIFMLASVVMSSYLVGICASLVAEEGTYHNGFEVADQIIGKNICLPGYYYYVFSGMVTENGGTATNMDSLGECMECLIEPANCTGETVVGILYDYQVLVGMLKENPLILETARVAEFGVFPYCEGSAYSMSFHWVLPDRRYLDLDFALDHEVYDTIINSLGLLVETGAIEDLLPIYDLKTHYENADPQYLMDVSSDDIYNLVFLVLTGLLVLFSVVVFSLGPYKSETEHKISTPRIVNRMGSFFLRSTSDVELSSKVG